MFVLGRNAKLGQRWNETISRKASTVNACSVALAYALRTLSLNPQLNLSTWGDGAAPQPQGDPLGWGAACGHH